MKHEIYKKEFNVGEMLSEAWKQFTNNFSTITQITLLVYIPINIVVNLLMQGIIGNSRMNGTLQSVQIVQVIEGFIGLIATIGIVFLIKQRIDGKKITLKEAFNKSIQKWTLLIATMIIMLICLLGLTLLLIIPGIIFSVFWIFTVYVVILEDKSFFQAMKYSKKIVEGRWWKTFGIIILFGFMAVLVTLILTGILGIFYLITGQGFVVAFIVNTAIDLLMTFFIVLSTVFFINFNANRIETIPKPKKN